MCCPLHLDITLRGQLLTFPLRISYNKIVMYFKISLFLLFYKSSMLNLAVCSK